MLFPPSDKVTNQFCLIIRSLDWWCHLV